MEYSQDSSIRRVRVIADYQFGRGAGEILFPEGCTFIRSSTGRVRQILLEGERLATLRAQDGRLTLSVAGGRRLQRALPFPLRRVVVKDEVAPFIAGGRSAFARHVIGVDPSIRAGDEVLIVDGEDHLLATGSAVLSGEEVMKFNYGVAVKVREGRDSGCFREE
ncbi:MAG: pseudouridine synthase [Methanomicrobiales archaeon]|nr:pseudouridine synthase [Methanomicrobiales archaeon]